MGFWSKLFSGADKPPFSVDASSDEASMGPDLPVASEEVGTGKGWLTRWRPKSRREMELSSLQAGYREMLDLIRSIREHLDRQNDVQNRMVHVLEKLPDSMEGLKSVNQAAEQQVEVLGLLRRQMESGVAHDQQLIGSMNRFNQTLGIMDETSQNSARAISDMVSKTRDSEKLLKDLVDRSEKRMLFVVAAFLVVVVAGVGLILFLGLSRPPRIPASVVPGAVVPRLVPVQAVVPSAQEPAPLTLEVLSAPALVELAPASPPPDAVNIPAAPEGVELAAPAVDEASLPPEPQVPAPQDAPASAPPEEESSAPVPEIEEMGPPPPPMDPPPPS